MRWLALLAPALALTSPVDILTSPVDIAATDVDVPPATCLVDGGIFRHKWEVEIPEVPRENIPKICGVLWAELKNGGALACVVSSPHHCKPIKGTSGNNGTTAILDWTFHTSSLCKAPIVEVAVARATKFQYEHVKCRDAY